MRNKVVRIKSLLSVELAIRTVWGRPEGVPRIVLVHGEPGQGKSTAVDRAAVDHGGYYLCATPVWAQRDLLEALAETLDVNVLKSHRNAKIYEAIVDRMLKLPKEEQPVVVIDEFDMLTGRKRLTELVRAIYDTTGIPFVLVGMTNIEAELDATPQFPQRIGQRVRFEGIDFEDAQKIVKERCEVELTEDLQRRSWERTRGNVRLFVDELAALEEAAALKGTEKLGVSDLEEAHE